MSKHDQHKDHQETPEQEHGRSSVPGYLQKATDAARKFGKWAAPALQKLWRQTKAGVKKILPEKWRPAVIRYKNQFGARCGQLWARLRVHPARSLATAGCVVILFLLIASSIYSSGGGKASDHIDIKVVFEEAFAETGAFTLSGLERFKARDIQENLTLEPEAAFTARKNPDGTVTVTLEHPRNIAYTGFFQVGDKGEQDSYRLDFAVNGPPLTVRLGNTSSAGLGKNDPLQLIFSEQVDIYSLSDHIHLEPRTSYSISYDLNKVTLTPDVEWMVTDNYQLAIDADYVSKTGKQFADNQVISFKVKSPSSSSSPSPPSSSSSSSSSRRGRVSFRSGSNYVLNEGADMTMLFHGENLETNVPVLVETWRMDSLEKYREQGHIYLNYDISMDSLEKLDTNAFLIEPGENRFAVPSFGEGAYLLSATYTDPSTGETTESRTSYLVTPLSVYMQSSGRDTVIWLNSAAGSAPLAGYEVRFGENHAGATDSNGLIILPHTAQADLTSFTIHDPEGALVYYDNTRLYARDYFYDRYYSYLFLDRTLYRPEDTVCFWGFIEPFRYNRAELPGTVTVRFDSGGLDIVKEVPLDENGVFTGEIELERIRSSQYAIQAELYFPPEEEGGAGTRQVVETAYVSVKEFEKPTFVLDSSIAQSYYGPDDTVTVVAPVSFYDGTPVPYYPVEVAYYDPAISSWQYLRDITTDSAGNAVFSFPANPGGKSLGGDKGLQSNRYLVQIANDGETVTHVGNYRYFPSDVLVESSIAPQGDGQNMQLTVRAYSLDMDSAALDNAVERGTAITNSWLLANARGPAMDVDLKIELRWSYYDTRSIRHQNRQSPSGGSYLQFDNAYSLDYQLAEERAIETVDDWETQAKRISVSTTGGVAVVRDLIYLHEDSVIDFDKGLSLKASVTYEDGKENSCSFTVYNTTQEQFERDTTPDYDREEAEEERVVIPGYSFEVVDVASGEILTPQSVWGDTISYNAGERASFQLLLDSEPVENPDARVLYTVVQEGLYEQAVVSGTAFQLECKTAYYNDARLVAVYFDGAETFYIKQLDIVPRSTSMRVNLEVTPDRSDYRPGDQVSLSVRATDYAGRGVPGNLCVAVVDESIFTLSEQHVNVLYELYKDMYLDNYVTQYCTTYRDEESSLNSMDGGKGGGGGVEFYDSYRSNFKDTAFFYPTTTDASGSAHITFTLPDNTTSWRVTAVAVGNDLRGGESKSNIIASLPFFVKPVLTSKYIEGDDVTVLVQGHGTLLDEESEINYTVSLTGDGADITLAGAGMAYTPIEFNFGKLDIGDYTLVARAQYSGYADTVELPVAVIKSNLELVVNRPVDVAALDIDAMRYPVSITLYDDSNEAFLTSINSLFGHYCMQANQRLSRFVAKRVVRQTVEGGHIPSYIADGNDYVADMQNSDGGIAPYPGAPSEPLVTTYVLLVAKDNFNLNAMSRYYNSQLESLTDPKLRAACYLGLAAIGDLETGDLSELLENEEERLDVQAYLIAALAYLGDTTQAGALYEERLSGLIRQANDGSSKDVDWERDAAAAWIAASILEHPDADTLSIHFGSARWRYRTLFECMIYVTNYNQKVTSTQFTYTLDGTSRQVDLGFDGMHTLVLSKSQLESIRFSGYPDSLRATAYYVGEPTEIGLEPSESMGIQKSVKQLDDNTYEVTLAIHLTADAPMGEYDISEWVPSNSRLYSYDQSYSDDDFTVQFSTTNENQNLYVSFNNSREADRIILYSYRIRRTYQSEVVLDTTYMIHGDSGENCNTQKSFFQPQVSGEANIITAENGLVDPTGQVILGDLLSKADWQQAVLAMLEYLPYQRPMP